MLTDDQMLRAVLTPIGVALLTPIYRLLARKYRERADAEISEVLGDGAESRGAFMGHDAAR